MHQAETAIYCNIDFMIEIKATRVPTNINKTNTTFCTIFGIIL